MRLNWIVVIIIVLFLILNYFRLIYGFDIQIYEEIRKIFPLFFANVVIVIIWLDVWPFLVTLPFLFLIKSIELKLYLAALIGSLTAIFSVYLNNLRDLDPGGGLSGKTMALNFFATAGGCFVLFGIFCLVIFIFKIKE